MSEASLDLFDGVNFPPLLTVEGLAEFLAVPVNTVYKWRKNGEGPKGYRIGKYVRFDRTDVMEWLESKKED